MAVGIYEFGEFRLDCGRFELTRRGRPIRLERKPMELLMLLAASGGQLVTRAEIAKRLWDSEVFVDTEHGINTAVRKIRQVLVDNSDEPRFVQTVTGMGYRFVAVVEQTQSAAADGGGRVLIEAEPEAATAIEDEPKPAVGLEAAGATEAERPAQGRRLFAGLGILAAVIVVAGLAMNSSVRRLGQRLIRGSGAPIKSLAVIPLDNYSGDAGQDYFADGMTDELTTMLAKSSTLRIVSRTSAMQFKGAHKSMAEIARALGVDGIVEGSVARKDGQVHMTLQLIRADTDSHLWAESYDRSANDVAELPATAAREIATYLKSTKPDSSASRFVNPEAHDAYLRGNYLWFRGQNEEAVKYFRKAVELQPDYALGWAGMSEYYGNGAANGALDPVQALPQTQADAEKSVALDGQLPEAHLVLAGSILMNQWDTTRALAEIDKSIELDPRYVQGIHWRARILSLLGKHQEAIETQQKADELGPFERPWALVDMENEARQFDAALEVARQRLEADPELDLSRNLIVTYRAKGMAREWADACEKRLNLEGDSASAEAFARAFKQGGQQAAVRWQLDQLERKAKTGYVSPVAMALLAAQLGDRERTLSLLEQGVREHSPLLLWTQFDPAYDFVHADARYRAVIKATGLAAQ